MGSDPIFPDDKLYLSHRLARSLIYRHPKQSRQLAPGETDNTGDPGDPFHEARQSESRRPGVTRMMEQLAIVPLILQLDFQDAAAIQRFQ